jgi:hypothetical protein
MNRVVLFIGMKFVGYLSEARYAILHPESLATPQPSTGGSRILTLRMGVRGWFSGGALTDIMSDSGRNSPPPPPDDRAARK